ncbi:MAG: hypothetical protein AB7F41_14535 [Methylocystis sp.]|uniref:hypothetical protein n=1 Tax=Methylocystis sp. TaxID=1911079 RepID=UPI003D1440DE
MIDIDYTISLGAIVNTVVIAAGGLMTLGALRFQLKSLDARLADLEGEAKKQTDILTTLARQDARLDALDTRFNDLIARLGRNPECHL